MSKKEYLELPDRRTFLKVNNVRQYRCLCAIIFAC